MNYLPIRSADVGSFYHTYIHTKVAGCAARFSTDGEANNCQKLLSEALAPKIYSMGGRSRLPSLAFNRLGDRPDRRLRGKPDDPFEGKPDDPFPFAGKPDDPFPFDGKPEDPFKGKPDDPLEGKPDN